MDLKSLLNEEQYEAATSDSQYLRIIAGAGTGKTRTLTYRIAHLIYTGIRPSKMVAITFTNKAAKEMLTRVDKLLEENNINVSSKPLMVTFHGFCYRFLKKEISVLKGYNQQFNIADDADQSQIYKDIFVKMTKGKVKDFTKAITGKISDLKTRGLFVGDVKSTEVPLDAIYTYDELMYAYTEYQNTLTSQNLLDFDDLLMLTLKILRNHEDIRLVWQSKYDIFLVDEFQDTNDVQYELIRLLMKPTTMLTVVGDPDQTIYTWRGARNEIIKDKLLKDFPTLQTVVLDENYRSTQSILEVANELIRNNRDRMEKNLVAASGEKGDKVTYLMYSDAANEAYNIGRTIHDLTLKQGVPYHDIAIIYRSNYLSNELEKSMTRFKIPYEIYGGLKFYERAEIKDALSYLRLIVNPDDLSFRRILKAPTKSIGDVALERAMDLKKMINEEENGSLFEIFRSYQEDLHLMKKSRLALDNFYKAYDRVKAVYLHHENNSDLYTAIRNYLTETGFMEYIIGEDKKKEDELSYSAASSVSKVDNVDEFLRSIQAYFEQDMLDEDGKIVAPSLEDFLIDVALQSDQDTMEDTDKIALMTGHVSKGLEFPYVFVTGLNQSIFPTMHALMDNRRSAIEEERRLLYVCLTRAKKKLYVSSFSGVNFRTGQPYTPSMFVKELNLTNKDKPASVQPKNYAANTGLHRASMFGSATTSKVSSNFASVSKAASASNDTYAVGDKVIHTSFGVGTVTQVFPDHKIMVNFPNVGDKKLMIGFKAFRKMSEDEANGNH